MARVLIVDDNAVNRSLLVALCEAFQLESDTAENGAAALAFVDERAERLEEPGYALVLMDIHMPGTDGIETARQIRARAPGPPPIVAVTADITRENAARCRDAGIAETLHKPIGIKPLAEVLCRHCTF